MGHFWNVLFQPKVNMVTELAISSFDNDLLPKKVAIPSFSEGIPGSPGPSKNLQILADFVKRPEKSNWSNHHRCHHHYHSDRLDDDHHRHHPCHCHCAWGESGAHCSQSSSLPLTSLTAHSIKITMMMRMMTIDFAGLAPFMGSQMVLATSAVTWCRNWRLTLCRWLNNWWYMFDIFIIIIIIIILIYIIICRMRQMCCNGDGYSSSQLESTWSSPQPSPCLPRKRFFLASSFDPPDPFAHFYNSSPPLKVQAFNYKTYKSTRSYFTSFDFLKFPVKADTQSTSQSSTSSSSTSSSSSPSSSLSSVSSILSTAHPVWRKEAFYSFH